MESIANPRLSISIFVVEDEPISLLSLVTTLAKKYPNVTVHKAANGRAGLELFKTHMPDMGGAQMAEKIHEIKPDTKFIILSGYSIKPKQEYFIGNGLKIDHYIVKPVLFHELFAAIEQCIG